MAGTNDIIGIAAAIAKSVPGTAGAAAVAAKEAAEAAADEAQEILESIPEDYSELSADVSDLKSAIKYPVNIEIGVNRFISSNEISIASNTKRASFAPISTETIKTFMCKIAQNYTVNLFTQVDGKWNQIGSTHDSDFSHTFDDDEAMFFMQILSGSNIASDAEPFTLYVNPGESVEKLANAVFVQIRFTSEDFTQGTISGGVFTPTNNQCISMKEFIAIPNGYSGSLFIKQNDDNGTWVSRITYYDANGTYISQSGSYSNPVEGEYDIPATAKLFKVSLSLKIGSTTPDITPESLTDNTVWLELPNASKTDLLELKYDNISAQIAAIKNDVSRLENTNIWMVGTEFQQGTLASGVLQPSNNYCISLIERKIIPQNTEYIYVKRNDPNGKWKARVTYYNDYGYMSNVGYTFDEKFVIPSGATFYRLSLSYYVNDVNVETHPNTLTNNTVSVAFDGVAYAEYVSEETDFKLLSKANKPIPDELTLYEYDGEKPKAIVNHLAYKQIGSVSGDSGTRQGAAVYGNYLFVAHSNNKTLTVFDLQSMTHVANITLPIANQSHSNNVNFGAVKYDSGDDYPLLYISDETAANRNCTVYRITKTGDTWGATIIQTISYPSAEESGIYYPNTFVDNTNGLLIMTGYTTNSYTASNLNKIKIITFALPDYSGGDVSILYADRLDEFEIPSISSTQGGIIKNNYIMEAYGQAISGSPGMIVQISLGEKKVVTKIVLADIGISGEPESVFLWNNDICVMLVGGQIYRFYFD